MIKLPGERDQSSVGPQDGGGEEHVDGAEEGECGEAAVGDPGVDPVQIISEPDTSRQV